MWTSASFVRGENFAVKRRKENDLETMLTEIDSIRQSIYETKQDAPYKEFISDETWEK